jgi:hypothetical protein
LCWWADDGHRYGRGQRSEVCRHAAPHFLRTHYLCVRSERELIRILEAMEYRPIGNVHEGALATFHEALT